MRTLVANYGAFGTSQTPNPACQTHILAMVWRRPLTSPLTTAAAQLRQRSVSAAHCGRAISLGVHASASDACTQPSQHHDVCSTTCAATGEEPLGGTGEHARHAPAAKTSRTRRRSTQPTGQEPGTEAVGEAGGTTGGSRQADRQEQAGPQAPNRRRGRWGKRGGARAGDMLVSERPPLPPLSEPAHLLAAALGDAAARGCSASVTHCPPGLPATAAALIAGIGHVAPAAAAAATAGVPQHVRMIVISPTLEDATQTHEMAYTLLQQQQGMSAQLVVGGGPLARDVGALRAACPTLLVATPGRLMDLVSQGPHVRMDHLLGDVRVVVLACVEQLLGAPAIRYQTEAVLRGLVSLSAARQRAVSSSSLGSGRERGSAQVPGQRPGRWLVGLGSGQEVLGCELGVHLMAAARVLGALPRPAAARPSSPSSAAAMPEDAPQAEAAESVQGHGQGGPGYTGMLQLQWGVVPSWAGATGGSTARGTEPDEDIPWEPARCAAAGSRSDTGLGVPKGHSSAGGSDSGNRDTGPKPLLRTQFMVVPMQQLELQLRALLASHAAAYPSHRVVVHCGSATLARAWAAALACAGIAVLELHSHKSAEYRSQALEVFRLQLVGDGSSSESTGASATTSGDVGGQSRAGWPGLVLLTAGGVLRGVDLPGLTLCVGLGLPRDAHQLAEQLQLTKHTAQAGAQHQTQTPHVLLLCEHELPGLAALQAATCAPLNAQTQLSSPPGFLTPAHREAAGGTTRMSVQWVSVKPNAWPWAEDVRSGAAGAGVSSTPPAAQPAEVADSDGSKPPYSRGRAGPGQVPRAVATSSQLWGRLPVGLRASAWTSLLGTYLSHPLLQPVSSAAWTRLGAAALELMALAAPPPLPMHVAATWGAARCSTLGCSTVSDDSRRTNRRRTSTAADAGGSGSGRERAVGRGRGGRGASSRVTGPARSYQTRGGAATSETN